MIIKLRRNLRKTLLLPLAQGRSVVDQTRFPRVLFNQVSKTPKDGDCTTFPKLPVLVPDCLHEEKCFSYMQGKCLLFKLMVAISSCHAPLWWGYSILPSARCLTVWFPQIQLLCRLNQPCPATSLVAEHTPVNQYLYWVEGHQTDSLMTNEEKGIIIPLHLLTMLLKPFLLPGHTAGSCPTCNQAAFLKALSVKLSPRWCGPRPCHTQSKSWNLFLMNFMRFLAAHPFPILSRSLWFAGAAESINISVSLDAICTLSECCYILS